MNRKRNQQTIEKQVDVHSEISELRRMVEQQSAQLEALVSKLEPLLKHSNSGTTLADENDYLFNRYDEIQAHMYDLQLATAIRLADGNVSKKIAYQQLVRRIRELVRMTVPRNSRLIVVSKGDEELLNLYGRPAWHFPQMDEGTYAGSYPSNSSAAIVQLEVLRAKGGDYLLFPQTALWWLEHATYVGFIQYLERRYSAIVHQEDTCVIFALRQQTRQQTIWSRIEEVVAESQNRLNHEPVILDWNTGLNMADIFPDYNIFLPPPVNGTLPYLDHTIDIVAVASSDQTVQAEAQRVAREAVLEFIPEQRGHAHAATSDTYSLSVNCLSDREASALPTTSIIIPVHNAIAHTETCLRSLLETLPRDFQGEIIIIDDASTDETPAQLSRWAEVEKRLKIVHNSENLGFLDSANRGAQKAKGDVIVFLNNDTVLLPGWLPPMLQVFRNFPDAGAVGGKLIFPDGTLQEAGGIIFCDGSAAHFGRGEHDTHALLYNYVREVDYCSGALLATKRALFNELSGFDTYYRPGYYEDTDYCFRVREKGFRVYYQPESVVVHLEGASSGNDLTRGMKRYQVINYDKFLARWAEALKWQPIRPADDDVAAWKALAVRGGFYGGRNE